MSKSTYQQQRNGKKRYVKDRASISILKEVREKIRIVQDEHNLTIDEAINYLYSTYLNTKTTN